MLHGQRSSSSSQRRWRWGCTLEQVLGRILSHQSRRAWGRWWWRRRRRNSNQRRWGGLCRAAHEELLDDCKLILAANAIRVRVRIRVGVRVRITAPAGPNVAKAAVLHGSCVGPHCQPGRVLLELDSARLCLEHSRACNSLLVQHAAGLQCG
jgi:hypothetical protein